MTKKKWKKAGIRCFLIISALLVMWGGIGVQTGSAEVMEEEEPVEKRTAGETDQWNFDYMDIEEAWDLIDRVRPVEERTEADRITVATLDTGVYYKHPDLRENVAAKNCVTVAGNIEPYEVYEKPKYQHGSSTSGVIAATAHNGKGIAGVAAGNHNDLISLMGVNVFHNEGYSGQGDAATEDIIKGIEYACDRGARVINMCLGHTKGDTDFFGNPHDDKALEKAINKAVYEKNVVVVCSAGNHNDKRAWYPSDFEAAISVINSRQYDNAWSERAKSHSSSFGAKKDISAPGRAIYTTSMDGNYQTASGTSMSAPSVAGVAAMMLYVNPDLTVKQVKNILYSTATDLYKPGYDIYTGHGNVNAYAAVAAAAGVKVKIPSEKLKRPVFRAESAGRDAIELSWKKVPLVNGYRIYRAGKKNGNYKLIKTTTSKETQSYIDKQRIYGKSYYYKIQAYGTTSDGKKIESAVSKPVHAKAMGPKTVSGLRCRIIDYKTVHLSWNKAEGADGYTIYRKKQEADSYKKVKSVSSGDTASWTNSGLKGGVRYSYQIRPYRKVGNQRYYGSFSAEKSVRTKPAKPSASIVQKGQRIILKWEKVKRVDGYEVYRIAPSSKSWEQIKVRGKNKSQYVDKGLEKGKKYRYRIRAYKKVHGERIYSSYSAVKTQRIK